MKSLLLLILIPFVFMDSSFAQSSKENRENKKYYLAFSPIGITYLAPSASLEFGHYLAPHRIISFHIDSTYSLYANKAKNDDDDEIA